MATATGVSNLVFSGYLTALYRVDFTPIIEYVEPYSGKLGHHKAEIFCESHVTIIKILNVITELGLSRRWPTEDHDADVIASSAGLRGGTIQIVFINDEALNIFKEHVIKKYQAANPAKA